MTAGSSTDAREALWAAAAPGDDLGLRARVVGANVIGVALVTTVSIVVALPEVGGADEGMRDGTISTLTGVVYLAIAIPLELRRSRKRSDRTFRWVDERREPSAEEVARTFDFPWVEACWVFAYWLGAAIVFVMLNLGLGNNLTYCLRNGLHIALGGLTASAVTYLLLERYNRPVFALALSGGEPTTVPRFGLGRRLLITWALGAAIPVTIIVTAPAGLTEERRASLGWGLVVVGVLALGAGLALTILAARSITEPIDVLRTAQAKVEAGDLEVDVQVNDTAEIGLLQSGFNRMTTGLRERQRLRDLFGRHVGDEVARRALSQQATLGGELRGASVLFVDLTGSTAMAQQRPPHEVVAVLNDLFSAVVRAAKAEGGWVNKFEGDAALCVFGPPADDSDHAGRALRAARLLQQELAALAAAHEGLDAGIGVSSGTVVAGNVGAEDRYEYTVIGDPVNEAARLTDEAKREPGRVLASGTAVAAAGDEAAFWHLLGTRTLRGRAGDTELYAPVDQTI